MADRYGTEDDDVLSGTFGIDNIAGYGGDDVLRGFSSNDILYGGDDDDWMDGGSGADTLYGLSGFDTASYELATSGVSIRLDGALCQNGVAEGDQLYSVEKVIGSDFSDSLNGLDGFAETMLGCAGDDIVYGSTGADTLNGGAGGRDLLVYAFSNGGVTVNLGANTASGGHAQGDTISGFEGISGSVHSDTLTGNGGANYLFGGFGDDRIRGGGGADTLGGSGGRDEFTGGGGGDVFLYNSVAESGTTAATRDVITDFSRSQGDRIDLSIDSSVGTPGIPDPFEFRGENGFTDARQVRFVHQNGDTIVQVNVDGSSGAELTIRLEGTIDLQAVDFIL